MCGWGWASTAQLMGAGLQPLMDCLPVGVDALSGCGRAAVSTACLEAAVIWQVSVDAASMRRGELLTLLAQGQTTQADQWIVHLLCVTMQQLAEVEQPLWL